MKIICAWCGEIIGEKDRLSKDTTHGICARCYSSIKSHSKEEVEDVFILDQLENINKLVERALYEKAIPDKNGALFQVLKHLVHLKKCLSDK